MISLVVLAGLLWTTPGCGGGGGSSDGDSQPSVEQPQAKRPVSPEPKSVVVPRIVRTVPEETAPESCGDLTDTGAGIYGVEATVVDCDTARTVASDWQSECANAGSPCTVSDDFECTYEQTGSYEGTETIQVTCESGDQRVTFGQGA